MVAQFVMDGRQHSSGSGVSVGVMKNTLLVVIALLTGSVSVQAQSYGSSTVGGAVLGGIVGAVIGNNSGGRHAGEGAVIGTVAGALLGSTADNNRTRTVYVQSPPPVCPPPPQVVYVQPAPQQYVVYSQPQPVVVYQQPVQAVVYVDAWGRPLSYGYRNGWGYYEHRR